MITGTPTISVIIPTHNRWASLRRTLEALGAQTYPLQEIEVLVVADGCNDETVDALRNTRTPFSLRILEQSCQGPAMARNHGAVGANGQLLIFLDDDLEAAQGLIEAHVRAHHRWPTHVVIGYISPVLQDRHDFFHNELRTWWEAMFSVMGQPGHRFTYRDLLSGNFSLEANLFARLGGFDPAFWCHEDYELGLRLIKAGIPFFFESDALGYHHETTTLDRTLERKYQEGGADVLLGHCYPEIRPVLPLARFKTPYLSYNLMCTLAFRWPAVGKFLVGWLRHGLDLFERIRLRRQWRQLLGCLLAYFYWQKVAEELSTRQALADFLQKGLADGTDPEIEIDLREGLEGAERRLDEARPAGARIRYGKQMLGRIPSQPGTERLRGVHLCSILATQLAKPLLKALAQEGVIGMEVDTSRLFSPDGSFENVQIVDENKRIHPSPWDCRKEYTAVAE